MESVMIKNQKFSREQPASGKQEPAVISFCITAGAASPRARCNYNESRDALETTNEPGGPLLGSNNLKSWNNKISTKSRRTIQTQEQTNPRENKATIFEERGAPTAGVPSNNIQKAIFSAPACYSERSSKYLERRRGDETRLEQWDFGSVMASVHLAPPALCSVCRVRVPSRPPPRLLSPGGVSVTPSPSSPIPYLPI